MSLYVDGSVLVKLFRKEKDSDQVAAIFESEVDLVISSLARLEALVAIDAMRAGGFVSARTAVEQRQTLHALTQNPPVRFLKCRTAIFEIAESQLSSGYCPTLDRLHLAAMEDFGLRRLFTNDEQQANAARALGYEVTLPR